MKWERSILPKLKDIAPKLSVVMVFPTTDASSAFWQIPLDASSRKLKTFITTVGCFCFLRLPFGIKFAPEIFQQKMSTLLKDHTDTEVVMDNIMAFGKDKENHDCNVRAVMHTIKSSGLKLNKNKCQFGKSELQYSRHIIGKDSIRPH